MAGVIFEGGALRGIFSAGVMDALIEGDIHFDYVIGVSAGMSNAMSYVSKQKGRNIEILKEYRNDPRYMSKRNLLKCGSLFDIDFLYDEIPNEINIYNRQALANYQGEIKAVVTNVHTGEAEYLDCKEMDKKCLILQATSALPFYCPPVTIGDKLYYDGGISDSIPIKKSQADGNKKNLIVLTQPQGYRKSSGKMTKLAAFLLKRKYPKMAQIMLERAEMYNQTIDYIEELEKNDSKNNLVIRPEYKLNSFEDDVNELEKTYLHGYKVGMKSLDSIKKNLF